MAATRADLERVIQQATPRIEDVRSVDREDFIRREHGHLNLRQVANSLDALEFTVDSFPYFMKEIRDNVVVSSEEDSGKNLGDAVKTAGPDTVKGAAIKAMMEAMEKNSNENGALAGRDTTTAVHGLLRAWERVDILTQIAIATTGEVEEAMEVECTPAVEASVGWEALAMEAKEAGSACLKQKDKDLAGALSHYSKAIQLTPVGDDSLKALFSNRSHVLKELGRNNAALNDACRCISIDPEWPKGHFRKATCLRQLDRLDEAIAAFRQGQRLEPTNKDWEKELDKTERLHRALLSTQARQLIWHILPELLQAWVRAGANGGVLQVQVNGELQDLGTPKAQLVRDKKEAAKASLRYAYLDEKGYMANLAANLQNPPKEGVAVVDVNGQPLKIAEIQPFVARKSQESSVVVHLDVKQNGKMTALIARVECDDVIRQFVPSLKDPNPPAAGTVEGVLQLQARSGFPKALPRYMGFQMFPGGDLNFPVIDLERDAPGAVPVVKTA